MLLHELDEIKRGRIWDLTKDLENDIQWYARELASRCRATDDGCWIWMGAVDTAGYGQYSYDGRQWGAHRLMYFLLNGAIPPKHLICHTCDNTKCLNPDHLFAGTAKHNVRDCINKGRRFRQ